MIKYIKALDAVTATTTSDAIPVEEAKKVSLMFTRANHSAGSSAFTVTGSLDGNNFIALNNIITDVTNTNAQTKTRVASVTLSSNTSQIVSLDLEHLALKAIKVVVTETTDGTHSALVLVEL